MSSNDIHRPDAGELGTSRRLVFEMAVELVRESVGALNNADINRMIMDNDSVVQAAADVCEAASIAGNMQAVENARKFVNKALVDF